MINLDNEKKNNQTFGNKNAFVFLRIEMIKIINLLAIFLITANLSASKQINYANLLSSNIDNTVIERPIWKDENGERPIMARDICVLFRKINEGE